MADDASPEIISNATASKWSNRFKLSDFSKEKEHAKRFFDLSTWQFLIIIGIAVSGLAAFVTTYDAISGINKSMQACARSSQLQGELNTQFIVLMVLSSFAVILGLVLAWFFRGQDNQRRLITLGIITTGIFGILYALTIKLQHLTDSIKLFASWLTFIGFLVLGWFLSRKSGVKIVAPITYDD